MNNNEMNVLTFKGLNGRDEFRREKIAERVIDLLTDSIDISPMVIDGAWGNGKTEFCHKLINKFKEEHQTYRLLYVDAFQADHADNPLVTVLSGVIGLLPEDDAKATLLKKAMPVVRFFAATASKALVAHLLKQEADKLTEDLESRLKDAADQAIDASVKTLLKDHEESQRNLQALQSCLKNIAEDKPIVIFIDELDRCRPDFAVQMLEVIKHTFNVEGVKFVLITNLHQLKAAINHRYGNQVDAQRYLDKFLKFSFRLPDFVLERSTYDANRVMVAVEHFSTSLDKSLILQETDFPLKKEWLFGFSSDLIHKNNLSLREVETFLRHLEIYQKISKGLDKSVAKGYQVLHVVGVFIFCFRPDITDSLIKNNANADAVAGIFGISNLPDFRSKDFYPSQLQSVAIMLAQACPINSEKYSPKSGQKDEINFWANDGYNQFYGVYRQQNSLQPVKDAILSLQLSIL